MPGSYDPPHFGHFDLARAAIKSGKADRVVMAVISNPAKSRLIDPGLCVTLVNEMMPTDLKDKIAVVESCKGVPSLAEQYDAHVVIRGAKETGRKIFSLAHEFAVAAYFAGHRLAHMRAPLQMVWIKTEDNKSSSDARKTLFSAERSFADLAQLMPERIAALLLRSASAVSLNQIDSASTDLFNALLGMELRPKPPASQAAAKPVSVC